MCTQLQVVIHSTSGYKKSHKKYPHVKKVNTATVVISRATTNNTCDLFKIEENCMTVQTLHLARFTLDIDCTGRFQGVTGANLCD